MYRSGVLIESQPLTRSSWNAGVSGQMGGSWILAVFQALIILMALYFSTFDQSFQIIRTPQQIQDSCQVSCHLIKWSSLFLSKYLDVISPLAWPVTHGKQGELELGKSTSAAGGRVSDRVLWNKLRGFCVPFKRTCCQMNNDLKMPVKSQPILFKMRSWFNYFWHGQI